MHEIGRKYFFINNFSFLLKRESYENSLYFVKFELSFPTLISWLNNAVKNPQPHDLHLQPFLFGKADAH